MKPKLVQNNNLLKIIENSTPKKKLNCNYIVIIIITIFICILHYRYKSKKSNNEDYIF